MGTALAPLNYILRCRNILHLYTAGEDYEHVLSNVYIRPDHPPVAVVYISIFNDNVQEGDERFSLELTAFDLSIVLVNNVVEVLIEDDDDDDGMSFASLNFPSKINRLFSSLQL